MEHYLCGTTSNEDRRLRSNQLLSVSPLPSHLLTDTAHQSLSYPPSRQQGHLQGQPAPHLENSPKQHTQAVPLSKRSNDHRPLFQFAVGSQSWSPCLPLPIRLVVASIINTKPTARKRSEPASPTCTMRGVSTPATPTRRSMAPSASWSIVPCATTFSRPGNRSESQASLPYLATGHFVLKSPLKPSRRLQQWPTLNWSKL